MLILNVLSGKAQDDFISLNEITINDITVLGENNNYLIQNFGDPNVIENYFFEMEDVQGEIYNYDGLLFYLIDDKIVSFEIRNSIYNFTSNNIRVGSNISSLQNVYPISYENRGEGHLGLNITNCDCFITIICDESGVIELISHTEP